MVTTTKPVTFDRLLADYAADVAFVAEEQPATTADDFIDQLHTAAQRLFDAGIHGAEGLEAATTYLACADRSEGATQQVLLKQAAEYLANVEDMRDEYELML